MEDKKRKNKYILRLEEAKRKLRESKKEYAKFEHMTAKRILKNRIITGMHSLVHSNRSPLKHITVCGERLIPRKQRSKKDSFYFSEFENATFYDGEVTCPLCLSNLRVVGDNCPICGVFFDTRADTYCGNCAKTTRKRPKLKPIDEEYYKELLEEETSDLAGSR